MESRSRAVSIVVLAASLLSGAGAGSLSAQSSITVGPPRTLTPPEVVELTPNDTFHVIPPLWTGEDWIAAWAEHPTLETYIQRVGPQGSISLHPSSRLAIVPPRSLVQLGSGYVLGTSAGAMILDHDLQVFEHLPEGPANLVSNGRTAFGWSDDLASVMTLTTGAVTPIDASSFAIEEARSGITAGAAGDGTFLLAWLAGTSDRPYQVWISLIGSSGEVLLERPILIHESQSRILNLDAAWDGERYLMGWTETKETLKDFWISRITEEGAWTDPVSVWTGALGAVQLVTVSPEAVLVAWPESLAQNVGRLRGFLIDKGEALPGAIVLSDRIGMIGSDRSGNLATVSRRRTEIRLSSLDTDAPLDKGSVTHHTDWLGLRYGTRDQTRVAVAEGTPLALWSPTIDFWGGPVIFGRFAEDRPRLEPIEIVGDIGWGYDLASNGALTLIVWAEEIIDQGGSSNRLIYARPADVRGHWLGPAVTVGSGWEPGVTPHGEGWLVVWRAEQAQLRYRMIGADGLTAGPERDLPAPFYEGSGISESQNLPTFASLAFGDDLLAWQEGDFQWTCHITCPDLPAPGVIRTIRIRDGIADPDSLQTYHGNGTYLGLPALARAGDHVLLSWMEQQGFDSFDSEVEGQFLDLNGDPVGETFVIAEGPPLDVVHESPSVVPVDQRFVSAWDELNWDPDGEPHYIRGAVVEVQERGAPIIRPFEIRESELHSWQSRLLPRDGDSVLLVYTRETPQYPYLGSSQITSRIITLDTPSRRRVTR